MKKLNTLLILFCLSCSSVLAASTTLATKSPVAYFREDRPVRSFSGIVTGGPLQVVITMGNTESLRLEGDPEAIAELLTEVRNGILEVRPRTKWNDWNRKYRQTKITVHISARRLNSLTLSGSGNILVKGTITGQDLVNTLSGSGTIRAQANVSNFTTTISGSGRVFQTGKTENAVLTLSGSGAFQGKDFTAENLSVQISGSGRVTVTADKALDAVVSGSGNITYYGNAYIKKTIAGSGSIRKG